MSFPVAITAVATGRTCRGTSSTKQHVQTDICRIVVV